jgi:hypothetical protein
MTKRHLTCAAIAAGVLALLSACGADGAPGATDAPSAGAGEQLATPTMPPNPFITETGIRMPILATREEWAAASVVSCEADAQVELLDGKARAVTMGPPGFQVTPGEPVYSSGDQTFGLPGVLLHAPVRRSADGRLVAGWRHCEMMPEPPEGVVPPGTPVAPVAGGPPKTPPPPFAAPSPVLTKTGVRMWLMGAVCEADALIEVMDEKTLSVTMAPAGFRLNAGEPVFYESGHPLGVSAATTMPVLRAADGRLVFAWRHCEYLPEPTQP